VCWPPVCSITIHGAADFAALSHQRWRIEEEFKRIKHRLALKAVSGLSWLTHQQDLAAKGLSDNLSMLLCLEALGERDGQISEHTPTLICSSINALFKINRTRSFAHIRQCLPRWLCNGVAPAIDDLTRLLRHIADNVIIRFIPGRNLPRPPQLKPHKAFAYKTVM
jgi:hypothetical protein